MGLQLDTRTIQREKRYMGFEITKHTNGTSSASLRIAIGYYDTINDEKTWVTEREEYTNLNNDQLTLMMGLRHGDLGLTASGLNLFKFLDTAIYAVMSDKIRLDYTYQPTVKDASTGAVLGDYSVIIKTGDITISHLYASIGQTLIARGNALLNVTVEINKYGYKPFSKTYTVLQGDVKEDIKIEMIPVPTPEVPKQVPTESTEVPITPVEEAPTDTGS